MLKFNTRSISVFRKITTQTQCTPKRIITKRVERQVRLDAGELPIFTGNKTVRDSEWTVAPAQLIYKTEE